MTNYGNNRGASAVTVRERSDSRDRFARPSGESADHSTYLSPYAKTLGRSVSRERQRTHEDTAGDRTASKGETGSTSSLPRYRSPYARNANGAVAMPEVRTTFASPADYTPSPTVTAPPASAPVATSRGLYGRPSTGRRSPLLQNPPPRLAVTAVGAQKENELVVGDRPFYRNLNGAHLYSNQGDLESVDQRLGPESSDDLETKTTDEVLPQPAVVPLERFGDRPTFGFVVSRATSPSPPGESSGLATGNVTVAPISVLTKSPRLRRWTGAAVHRETQTDVEAVEPAAPPAARPRRFAGYAGLVPYTAFNKYRPTKLSPSAAEPEPTTQEVHAAAVTTGPQTVGRSSRSPSLTSMLAAPGSTFNKPPIPNGVGSKEFRKSALNVELDGQHQVSIRLYVYPSKSSMTSMTPF